MVFTRFSERTNSLTDGDAQTQNVSGSVLTVAEPRRHRIYEMRN